MSSLPPPSQSGMPSSGGNGKYIAVVLLLVIGIGGLAFWKLRGPSTDTPKPINTVATSSSSSTINNALVDDVPPPPPIIDSGPANTSQVVYTNGGDPCLQTVCNGSAAPGSDTESGLAMLARQTRRKCYEPALGNDPTLQGHVKVQLKIASTGRVCSASVSSNDMSSSSVGECAARMLQASGHVPPPKGGCVNINFPISYVPAGQH